MRTAFLAAAVLSLLPATAAAQEPGYPSRPVRFVVPYAPGGSSDVIARILGLRLAESLGQTFVVDNRPGAGSMIGTDVVAKSTPDGYTILLSDMPHTINPSIYLKVPYDPVRDFSPITLVGKSPLMLFVHAGSPARTLRDFVALAKAQPGKIPIGSGGTGASTHLLAELLQIRAGIQLNHVPYKGAGPALADVVAGQIPVTFTSMATAAPHVKAGRLRVLAVTSAKRIAALPETPTFEEGGVPGMVVEHWWGVMAPAGVAAPLIERLRAEIVKVVAAADTRERFATLALEPATNTPGEFRALLVSETQRWSQVVRSAGIKAN